MGTPIRSISRGRSRRLELSSRRGLRILEQERGAEAEQDEEDEGDLDERERVKEEHADRV